MSIESAVPVLVGDLSRFGALTDRLEGLIEAQVSRYRLNASEWVVLPWSNGLHLFSEDTEGQRRGRETLVAFLGPSVVSIETIPASRLNETLPAEWQATGLTCAAFLNRVPSGPGADEMLARLEDMVATTGGRVWRQLELSPTQTDLLRDFRLALLARDDGSASRLLDSLRLNGHVSAENLRFLRLEYLAAFGRWADIRALPHTEAMVKARRPRAISEILLQAVWWTELATVSGHHALATFRDREILQLFGPLLRSIKVPATREGRVVAFLTATVDGDSERQEAILDKVEDSDEQFLLQEFRSGPPPSTPTDDHQQSSSSDPIAVAFASGQFGDVIEMFIGDPSVAHADIAVQAVLESGVTERASQILSLVRDFDSAGELKLGRRERRDIDELEQLAGNICDGWLLWSKRVAGEARWADASSVARDRSGTWTPISELTSDEASAVGDALIEAAGGSNDDQLRAGLDLLCKQAAGQLARGAANDFCQAVLLILAEQDNFSEMVRSAYADLYVAWLDAGPSRDEYGKVLYQTGDIWNAIASANSVGWAICVLEAAVESPCPDKDARMRMAVSVIDKLRQIYGRASLRERVDVESLAEDVGLPSERVEVPARERDVWSVLDGKLLGLYSLLPRAATLLGSRLARLSSIQVKGNDDQVATPALRALADRADYFIVDTWHAAHQATGAIDSVRPRHRQILPQQRGVSGFLKALEMSLDG